MKVSKYRMAELNCIGLVLSQAVSLMNTTNAKDNDTSSFRNSYVKNLYDAYMELLEGVEIDNEE